MASEEYTQKKLKNSTWEKENRLNITHRWRKRRMKI
jgi:hypothetical protein